MLSREKIIEITNQTILVSDLSDSELAKFCQIANQNYRAGSPIISDEDYDFIFIAELIKRIPTHPFLQKIESDTGSFAEEKIKLPEKMLSTDKAYSWDEIKKWLERIAKFSEEINYSLNDIQIKGTAKLDGFAGYDDGCLLYTSDAADE